MSVDAPTPVGFLVDINHDSHDVERDSDYERASVMSMLLIHVGLLLYVQLIRGTFTKVINMLMAFNTFDGGALVLYH